MTLVNSFFYAARILHPKGKVTSVLHALWGSIACVSFSLVPLICTICVTQGMIKGISDRVTGLSCGSIQVRFSKNHPITKDYKRLLDFSQKLEYYTDIKKASPEIQSPALVAANGKRSGCLIRAVPSDIFASNVAYKKFFDIKGITTKESVISFIKQGQAVIGQNIADTLDIKAGDKISVVVMKQEQATQINELDILKATPKIKTFEIKAIVTSGYQELDALWVFIPLEQGASFLQNGTPVINLTTDNPYCASVPKLKATLNQNLPQGVQAFSWQELNRARFSNLASTKTMLVFIMFLIVIVATLNITSCMFAIVQENQSQIAILKALGASNAQIKNIFLILGFLCGTTSIFLGLPLGLLVGVNINKIIKALEQIVNFFCDLWYHLCGTLQTGHITLLSPAFYLQDIPICIPFLQVFLCCAGAVFLCVLMTVLPAKKAGSQELKNAMQM